MEEALETRFPLLKDVPHTKPEDVPPLTSFVQAMSIPVLRDYSKPPPPVPDNASARLQKRLEQIDRHAAAVNHNFHFLAQVEARRIADLCEQEENEMRALNELDGLPIYGLGGGEDPTTLDLDVLLGQEPDGAPERYALPQGLTQQGIEFPNMSVLSHMPRKVLQLNTLNLIKTALNNMEGRAGAAGQQKEAARREIAMETARRFSEPQSTSLTATAATGITSGSNPAGASGEAMDTSSD